MEKRNGWVRGAPKQKSVHPKSEKVAPKKEIPAVRELLEDTDLNDKQKAFCIYYLQRYNANMSTVWGQVTGIATKNMIENLKKAAYIGNIEYYMEIPTSLAAEYTQLSEGEYKKLKNQKFIKLQCKLVTEKRGVSAFDDSEEVGGFFKGLKNNPFIKKVRVKMKNKKEDHVTEVQLVNNPLNYSINFDFDAMSNTEYDKTISERIQSEYNTHKKEINDVYK